MRHTGQHLGPAWLDSHALWSALLEEAVMTPAQAAQGASRYAGLVQSAPGVRLWDEGVHKQVVLGSEAFAARVLAQAGVAPAADGIRYTARAKPLQEWLGSCATREQAFWNACHHGGYTMTCIAKEVDLSVQQLSRLVARWNRRAGSEVKSET